MLSAAWRPAANIAMNKNGDALITSLRHGTEWEPNRFVAFDR